MTPGNRGTPLLPGTGAWIGILGGGQLGRMLALEARRMGYRTCVLDPDPACPAARVADDQVVGALTDPAAAALLAGRVSVIACEFENISTQAVATAEEIVPVIPGSPLLEIAQHRVREKESLARLGFPVPAHASVKTRADLETGLKTTGLPAVLKTATGGYDGKGQKVVESLEEAITAWETLLPHADVLILERLIPLNRELSVICARDVRGRMACYPVAENIHREGILDATVVPARIPAAVAQAARELAMGVAEGLDLVGLLAVEMFLTHDGDLLINELAPRPHNSGHYTLDACACSQFEQLLRISCRLPLGSTKLLSPAAMVNLLGDIWIRTDGQPDFAAALAVPGVKLHLYDKQDARPQRKMGHLTATAANADLALAQAQTARVRAQGLRETDSTTGQSGPTGR